MTENPDIRSALEPFRIEIGAINDLLCAASVLTWDSRTMMPAGGAETRGQQIATLTRAARDRLLGPDLARALEPARRAVEALPEDDPNARAVAQTLAAIAHHERVPASLVEARAALRTPAQAAWTLARERADFSLFAPFLSETMALTRAYADAIGWEEHRYDAMVSLFEPGETARSLRDLFARLRTGIAPILDRARARPPARTDFLTRGFSAEGQRRFGLAIAQAFGYDLARGRLDTTVHPFEVSFTRNDVRITTRWREDWLPMALFGIFHETGHALYEQNVDAAYTRTPLATDLVGLYAVGGTSFGAHESQSRLYENHVARTLPFWQRHFPDLQAIFPDRLADADAQDYYRAVTRAEPGFIRVEADELTYDLHIMLRVELETALMDESLAVGDLPAAWADIVRRDLGLVVPDDARGVLQDVHWSSGYVGSFPTYTIGNVMAAQLMESARDGVPGLDDALGRGDYAPLGDFLREAIWRHGRRFLRDELLQRATGRPLDPEPYLRHLQGKYGSGAD